MSPRLTAILASGQPPDLVRGISALDTPYFAAREVAENLDPYFAKSTVLKADDLDPVNDLWRYDGKVQGKGPRYGMAKDFSQDSMYCYNTAHFDEAGVDYPSDTEPVTYEVGRADLRGGADGHVELRLLARRHDQRGPETREGLAAGARARLRRCPAGQLLPGRHRPVDAQEGRAQGRGLARLRVVLRRGTGQGPRRAARASPR